MLLAVLAGGCAVADRGSGGDRDMSVAQVPDDLAGVDLSGVVPDLAGADLAGADFSCEFVSQLPCAAGQKCTLRANNKGECVTEGDKNTGELCGTMGTDDCKRSNECTIEQSDMGAHIEICRQFCGVDTDCKQTPPVVAGNKPLCLYQFGASGPKVCTFACNPVSELGASGCAAGLGCETFAFNQGGTVIQGTDCVALPPVAGNNTDCTAKSNLDCQGGFTCVDNGTNKRCRKVCQVGNNAHCATIAGTSCQAPSNIPTASFGFCL
jgi:hypothetical protein